MYPQSQFSPESLAKFNKQVAKEYNFGEYEFGEFGKKKKSTMRPMPAMESPAMEMAETASSRLAKAKMALVVAEDKMKTSPCEKNKNFTEKLKKQISILEQDF